MSIISDYFEVFPNSLTAKLVHGAIAAKGENLEKWKFL